MRRIARARTTIVPTPSNGGAVEAEGEQTGVTGDDGAHLVGELEAPSCLPALRAQDLVGQLAEPRALGLVEQRPVGGPGGEDVPPVRWEPRPVTMEEAGHPLSQPAA